MERLPAGASQGAIYSRETVTELGVIGGLGSWDYIYVSEMLSLSHGIFTSDKPEECLHGEEEEGAFLAGHLTASWTCPGL